MVLEVELFGESKVFALLDLLLFSAPIKLPQICRQDTGLIDGYDVQLVAGALEKARLTFWIGNGISSATKSVSLPTEVEKP